MCVARWVCLVMLLGECACAERYLYPIMEQGGPNNQYQQFFESVLMAKALKRTVALAPFHSWVDGPGPEALDVQAALTWVRAI